MQRYPLQWPVGYKRTDRPRRSAFKNPTLGKTVENVIAEICRLNGDKWQRRKGEIFISSNIPLRNDGLPRADYFRSNITDKGVAVYFKKDNQDVVLCCDQWDSVEQNLHAIYKSIEALRAVERWGVSDFINKSFAGFTALPESTAPSWWQVLGFLIIPESFAQVVINYKTFARKFHPDNGGDTYKMQTINAAYEDAKRYFNA